MKSFDSSKNTTIHSAKAVLAAAVCSSAVPSFSSMITEPPTTFYGQVIGVGGERPFVMTEGDLDWTILRADDSELNIGTDLHGINDGAFSYQLRVPHAVPSGSSQTGEGIPMPPTGDTNEHAVALVNGVPAEFIGPSGAYFEVGQRSRAATYRLDLMVDIAPLDSDGDGLPDWWERENGLNPFDASDAGLDGDGDGWSNRQEYLAGSSPSVDDRRPGLVSAELLVYAERETGLMLKSVDADSDVENVVYELRSVPGFGDLLLLNDIDDASNPDRVLAVGSFFTQADVDDGRLVFAQKGAVSAADQTSFEVLLSDENGVAAEPSTVLVSFFEAPVGDVKLSRPIALRKDARDSSSSSIIWDGVLDLSGLELRVPTSDLDVAAYADFVAKYGEADDHYFLGGRGADRLTGGYGDDVFVALQGDNTLTGGRGADRFVFSSESAGTNRVTDFSVGESDVLDFAEKTAGLSGRVGEHLAWSSVAGSTFVRLDDLTVELSEQSWNDDTLYDLMAADLIDLGGLRLLPRVHAIAADAEASENAGNSGIFRLTRDGDWADELTVSIGLGGTALNGVDYSAVGSSVTFAAGQKEVDVSIAPFEDGLMEGRETIELLLVAGDGYKVGANDRAHIALKDLAAVVGLEVVEPLATRDPLVPGVVFLTRSGQTAGELSVRFSLGGTASNGRDYQYVSTYAIFSPGQRTKALEFLPRLSESFDGVAETVDIEVLASDDYALGDVAEARVTLIERRDSFGDWMEREFPDASESAAAFARADHGNLGVDHLRRYAFGMDARNPDAAKMPRVVWRDGRMTVDVSRNPEATDVRVVVEGSDDLTNWTASETKVRRIVPAEHVGSAEVETYEWVPLVEAEDKAFIRIRVEYLD